MAKAVEDYNFSHQEVVEALIKHKGLHEGLWSLRVEFALGAANVYHQSKEVKELTPAAIVPLQSIGLQKSLEANNLTLDAAVVNPKDGAKSKVKKGLPKKS